MTKREKPILHGSAVVEITYRQEYTCSNCGAQKFGYWNSETIWAKSLPEARAGIAKVERISKLNIENIPLDWIYADGKFLCEKCKEEYYEKEME